MLTNKFELTFHARDQLEERFPKIKFRKEIKSVCYCTKEEVYRLKQTKSYQEIKKGNRYRYNFYKTQNNMYLVCETKPQRKGVYYNIVITVIDLLNSDYSLEDYLFNKAAIEAAYRLQRAEEKRDSERLNPIKPTSSKKKNKKSSNTEKQVQKVKANVNVKKTPEEKLDDILRKLGSKDIFAIDITRESIDAEKLALITVEMKNFNNSINRIVEMSNLIEEYKETEDNKILLKIKEKINSFDKIILKDIPSFKYYKKEGFKENYLNFIAHAIKCKSEAIFIIYKNSGSYSRESYTKYYNSFLAFSGNFKRTEEIQKSLDMFGKHILNFHRKEMKVLYKQDSCVERKYIETAVRHLYHVGGMCPILEDEADKLADFFVVIENMFYELNLESFYIKDYV